jgi:hypothetical protein
MLSLDALVQVSNGEVGVYVAIRANHHIESLTADAAAQTHQADLDMPGKYGVQMQRFRFEEKTGKVFCLIKGPTRCVCLGRAFQRRDRLRTA